MRKLLSLFDGSGGFLLSGAMCGIVPAMASEIEPYPIAVTRSRFPSMKHLGDISKINGAEIEPVDVLTFGFPCQDVSVAGKRAGIKHEDNGDDETTRSGLVWEAVRIIKEMRCATNGKYPSFAVFENVPGLFSAENGETFRTVIEGLIKIVEPNAVMPEVSKSGWAYADSFCGDGWSLAYRVFDAQYWGVPQRRRRIYLVADFRGERAGEILFEREGLRGYFTQGGTPWQTAPAEAQGGTVADDREGAVIRAGGFKELNSAKERSDAFEEEIAPTLAANKHDASVVIAFDGYNAAITDDKSATLGVNCGMSTGRNGVVYAVDQGGGKSSANVSENIAPTLCTTHGGEPAIARAALFEHGTKYIVRRLTPTECARLQGFPDRWGDIEHKAEFTDEEYRFWLDVRNTHARINGRQAKDYTEKQMLNWYNKLHTDSAEYKMWGNGIALPCALYVMQGIAEKINKKALAEREGNR